jgi:hypothetical protein
VSAATINMICLGYTYYVAAPSTVARVGFGVGTCSGAQVLSAGTLAGAALACQDAGALSRVSV